MNIFFDSSVLIPVFYADHAYHEISTQAFLCARKGNSFCALHTLSEVYSILTGLPIRPRITGAEGIDILRQILERITLVTLTEAEHLSAIETASTGIVGGAIYDALIASCAVKAGTDVLLTWNPRDFTRLSAEIRQIVRSPLEFKPTE